MDDLLDVEKDAGKSFTRFLRNQRNTYIERLKAAPVLPTSVLVEARTLRSIQREDKPEPPHAFEVWVNSYILTDSPQQLEMWVEEGRDWMQNAAILAGTETLLELAVDVVFNQRDTKLLRWLSERSRRSAQLIQGATDEDVLMNLWDVVYEGHFSINKATAALQESFAFSKGRAERIARTEILSAGRAGQFHGDRQSGIVIGKKWMAAQNERTRRGHREADGQVVAFDEPFYVANGSGQLEPLMFPSDSSLGASASNVIQCRCWYKRILEGEELE
ncbi:phage minor head protein [Bacillaceae bacterium C204]|uniref:phage minor head protein n=1 Tax=Neobacillus sp. 204 TaxID=3383351 RepID=UPI003979B708